MAADMTAVVDPAEFTVAADDYGEVHVDHNKCWVDVIEGLRAQRTVDNWWPTLADVLTAVIAHKCPEAR